MSILIEGMEMPKDGDYLFSFASDEKGENTIVRIEDYKTGGLVRYRGIVNIPTPHGRLIDADALMADVRKHSESYFADDFAHEWVDLQPTIIEAEEQ